MRNTRIGIACVAGLVLAAAAGGGEAVAPSGKNATEGGANVARITFKGTPVQTAGTLPAVGSQAPGFKLTAADLSDKTLADFAGKTKIISIVPSLDTGVCAMSAKKFNERVSVLPNTVLLNVSADLPFAQKRFCDSNSLKNIVTLSTFRSPAFGRDYGVQVTSGPLAGLMSRAVVVLDARDKVVYTEQVPEIAQEPNYDAALAAIRAIEK
jgi:thioredoxin-dependent peroxiredoxin